MPCRWQPLARTRITTAMPTTTTAVAWPPERIDRLARALLAAVFPDRAAPVPAVSNVVQLADYRRPAPCPD
jgi:hypothetical protein